MKPIFAGYSRFPQFLLLIAMGAPLAWGAQAPRIKFDHVHTYAEVVSYLEEVVAAYPEITRLHTIGQSYLGKDLLVLELTNRETGDGLDKPGYWIDGNLHAGEVAGGEIALHTIKTLTSGYGSDPKITSVLDDKVFYIMPKLNPDGSDHVITRPDNLRSVVRPFDDDGDGQKDEDPGEDLNGDGYITMMRVRDPNGALRTSPDDPRLMVSVTDGDDPTDWQGEWTVYTEGVDSDGDGRFNEDGVGGIDINRNFPENWQPHPISYQPGPYPLSEAESRAVVDFQLTLPNLTGLINYHMSGNVAVYPPSNQRVDPLSGDKVRASFEDEKIYKRMGGKIADLVKDDVEVNVFKIHGASPASWHGSIWGTYVDWAYFQNGIFSWIFEFGVYPQTTAALPARPSESERLRISDKMGGKLFVDWQPYDHPQLGEVEIGGFLRKIYMPDYGTYTSIGCLPGERYDRLLEAHTNWHLYLIEQSPLVRVTETQVEALDGDLVRIRARIENTGLLPSYVTQQALDTGIAVPVRANIELHNAALLSGSASMEIGHLEGGSSRSGKRRAWVEWLAKTQAGNGTPMATVTAVSQKGGTDSRNLELR
ncbi:M14 family metallopeptidase [Elongatibacter sediminis]|uniref:M14 family metallopeptidase n=1 Tax=Elongatibacter sediminis TaxID=3119006 RepID=A0AAW9RAH5_9GAMM